MTAAAAVPAQSELAALAIGDRADPGLVRPLQTRYRRAMWRGYRRVRGHVETTVGTHDALVLQAAAGPVRRFGGATPAARRDAFAAWLGRDLEAATVDGVSHGTFIRSAYARGVVAADQVLARDGRLRADAAVTDHDDVLSQPVHRRAADTLAGRVRRDMDDINSDVVTDAAAIVAAAQDGALDADPAGVAADIADRIDRVGMWRSGLVARTATMDAMAHGTLRRYRERGRGAVTALVEEHAQFTTVGDRRTCTECLALEGMVFTLTEAQGVIPVHANCRCMWLFVDVDDTGRDRFGPE